MERRSMKVPTKKTQEMDKELNIGIMDKRSMKVPLKMANLMDKELNI